jgi:hypothetical protein
MELPGTAPLVKFDRYAGAERLGRISGRVGKGKGDAKL